MQTGCTILHTLFRPLVRSSSFPRLSPVVVLAQHLTVRRVGLPALVPRLDVIA
jgi:hypothetical protein